MVPHARQHDAVGRMAWAMEALFRRWEKETAIFTERQQSFHFGPWRAGPLRKGLKNATPPWAGAPAPDVNVYQHSIGTVVADRFLSWPAKTKVLLYQNITPSDLPGLSGSAKRDQDWGREQLKSLIEGSDLQVSISEYTCRELRALGAKNVLRLPYLSWHRDITPGERVRTGPTLLVVGRVVPHKGIREAVLTLAELRKTMPSATLTVLGSLRGDDRYVESVKATILENEVKNAVVLKGVVSDSSLVQYYRTSGALLSLSEHEGFCVPLVEAMQARTPIVALNAAAVPETLGNGGLLIDNRDPVAAAAALHRVLTEIPLREALAQAQTREAKRFATSAFEGPLKAALHSLNQK